MVVVDVIKELITTDTKKWNVALKKKSKKKKQLRRTILFFCAEQIWYIMEEESIMYSRKIHLKLINYLVFKVVYSQGFFFFIKSVFNSIGGDLQTIFAALLTKNHKLFDFLTSPYLLAFTVLSNQWLLHNITMFYLTSNFLKTTKAVITLPFQVKQIEIGKSHDIVCC